MRYTWLLALACAGLHAQERPLSDFRQRVGAAIAAKATRVVIPPGVYRGVPEDNGACHLCWHGVSGLEIVADGVTLLCGKPTRALAFDHCADITLRGLTVDYDPLPFTQGDVAAVDAKAGWLDVKIHAGYPVEAYSRIDICDRQTRYRKRGKPFMWDSKAELRPDGVVRVTSRAAAEFAQVGDLASLGGFPPGVIAHAVVFDDCDRITLDRVTVHASNCMGIILAGGEGGHRLSGCRVVPGPTPAGATESRILSTNADAILCGPQRIGPVVENCDIRDAGDDSWSIQSEDYVVVRVDGNQLWYAARGQSYARLGDRLQARLGEPMPRITALAPLKRSEAGLDAATADKLAQAKPWEFWKVSDTVMRCTLDAPVPFAVGQSIYNVDRQGNGFVFRGNRVRSSGRVLIKASGLVEGNTIDTPYGLCANPEIPARAAAGIASLVIRGNTIIAAHTFNEFWQSSQAGAISVTADDGDAKTMRPPGVYGRVVIEDNTIRGGNGVAIVVSSTDDLILRGNKLIGIQHEKPNAQGGRYAIDNHAGVWLSQCAKVTYEGSSVSSAGEYLSQELVLGPGVSPTEPRTK